VSPFVQIDSVMAEAVRRGGAWIACRPGCAECCIGPFAVSPSDAQYLRETLSQIDPLVAGRVRTRAAAYMAAIRSYDEDGLPEDMDEVPCPALDPVTRCCDLYEARPFTCRTFGPAVRTAEGAIGTCELCFEGATEDELASCAVDIPPELWEFDPDDATFVAAALTDSVVL
jgi:Fe-S-cluster containining protein